MKFRVRVERGAPDRMMSELMLSRIKPTMIDPFGRVVTYLRVSVTDRCDLRCVYCMSEHMTFLPKRDLLTLEELNRLCSVFISKGVRKQIGRAHV